MSSRTEQKPRPNEATYLEDLAEDGAGEESSMLEDDKVSFVFVAEFELVEEPVGGLADDHGCGREYTSQYNVQG